MERFGYSVQVIPSFRPCVFVVRLCNMIHPCHTHEGAKTERNFIYFVVFFFKLTKGVKKASLGARV